MGRGKGVDHHYRFCALAPTARTEVAASSAPSSTPGTARRQSCRKENSVSVSSSSAGCQCNSGCASGPHNQGGAQSMASTRCSTDKQINTRTLTTQGAVQHLMHGVERPLAGGLAHRPRLFQQVCRISTSRRMHVHPAKKKHKDSIHTHSVTLRGKAQGWAVEGQR